MGKARSSERPKFVQKTAPVRARHGGLVSLAKVKGARGKSAISAALLLANPRLIVLRISGRVRRAAPSLGQDNAALFSELAELAAGLQTRSSPTPAGKPADKNQARSSRCRTAQALRQRRGLGT